uniref:COesterase domain-containing protein n=1 Tax=Ascaris lumbricoides TaxID=6252 RepID=A0A0M3I0H8_ASCLU
MSSDLLVTNAAHNCAVEMMCAGHTVYLYNFKYFTSSGLGCLGWLLPFHGATHCVELPYLFGKGILANFNPSDADIDVLENFTTLFTNCAKYGREGTAQVSPLAPIRKRACVLFEYVHTHVGIFLVVFFMALLAKSE